MEDRKRALLPAAIDAQLNDRGPLPADRAGLDLAHEASSRLELVFEQRKLCCGDTIGTA
jgi:hypothetical protein